MLERPAEVGTLASGIFNHRRHPLAALQRPVDGFAHQLEAGRLRDLLQVAARMKIEVAEPQLFAALHFVQKGVTGLGEAVGVGMTQIDEVAVVGQDLLGQKPPFSQASLKARMLASESGAACHWR